MFCAEIISPENPNLQELRAHQTATAINKLLLNDL